MTIRNFLIRAVEPALYLGLVAVLVLLVMALNGCASATPPATTAPQDHGWFSTFTGNGGDSDEVQGQIGFLIPLGLVVAAIGFGLFFSGIKAAKVAGVVGVCLTGVTILLYFTVPFLSAVIPWVLLTILVGLVAIYIYAIRHHKGIAQVLKEAVTGGTQPNVSPAAVAQVIKENPSAVQAVIPPPILSDIAPPGA